MRNSLPIVALTMGDVAGIGPEVALKAALDNQVREHCTPVIIGHPEFLNNASKFVEPGIKIQQIENLSSFGKSPDLTQTISCWNPVADQQKDSVLKSKPNQVNQFAGNAAYQYLVAAIELAKTKQIDAITTAPISKSALHAAGHYYPGHTEILAEKCGIPHFGMMLYLPTGERIQSPNGLGVVHTTLHTSIQSVPKLLSEKRIHEKIKLIHQFMKQVACDDPRIGVCALNPHAGEEGLFGNEEQELIKPAILAANNESINASGPFPADTLLKRAAEGEFDGIVAMYHDQGHIAFKLLGFHQAVNVTLGLPFVRTSPSHGTAFDIAWEGKADPRGMIEAVLLATKLAVRK